MIAGGRTAEGELELAFERRAGRTVLVRDRQKAPLLVVRPFELEPGTLIAFVVNPTGGVLGGDRFRVSVSLGPGARVVLVTQSATRLHRMEPGLEARQETEFRVAVGARLEYYPERTIPFAGSSFSQALTAWLEPGAEFGLLESLAAGRVAMGERLAFRRYRSRTRVVVAGRLVYLDALDLEPGRVALGGLGALEGQDYLASGLFVGAPGASPLPGEPLTSPGLALGLTAAGHVFLRALAASGPEMDRQTAAARNELRGRLFGAGPLVVRR